MRHSHHVVVEGGGGQPDSGGQLVVEQRQLRHQTLRLLLLGGQRRQPLPDAHQGLDELPLGRQAHRLEGGRQRSEVRGQRVGSPSGNRKWTPPVDHPRDQEQFGVQKGHVKWGDQLEGGGQ